MIKGTNHDFDRREDDVNYKSLHVRVTVLEKLVNEVMMPNLTENTRLTASIDARTDEMYTAFTTAKNGIRVITAVGNGIVKLSDIVEKRPKTLLLLTAA